MSSLDPSRLKVLTCRVEQFLRPRWTALYAARKKQKNAASRLPELPDTLFGWIPVLYRITEGEVLASAGLDAFVVSVSRDCLPFLVRIG